MRYATYAITYVKMTMVASRMARVSERFDHTDHTLTRGGITAKCHSTAGRKLIAAILDELGKKVNMPGC